MRNYPVQVLSAVDTASQTGSAIFVGQAAAGSFIPVFGDATAAGTLKIQGSNAIAVGKPESYTPPSASFADVPSATSTVVAGVAPAIVLSTMNFQYIRVIYTRTGGGTTTVVVNASFLSV